MCEV